MGTKLCWLCCHCDHELVIDLMKFVEEKSPVMHIDVICSQLSEALKEQFPDEDVITDDEIKQHICRHVVTPVASVTRITRDLLDMCETLRPTKELLSQRKQQTKRPAIEDNECTTTIVSKKSKKQKRIQDNGDNCENNCENDNDEDIAPSIALYLRTVGHVMGIYRMHSKLMQMQ